MAVNPYDIPDDDPEYQQLLKRYGVATAPNPQQNTGFGGDTLTSLKRGVEQIPGMVTGLADIGAAPFSAATGINRPFSRLADAAGELTGFQPGKWAKEAEAEYSPQYQESKRAFDEAQGFTDSLGAIVKNPRYALGTVAESLPSMVAGAGAGGLAVRGALGAERLAALRAGAAAGDTAAAGQLARYGAGAAGLGEGAVTAGQQMDQLDYDIDPLRAAGTSLAAGALTGAIGYGAGRLANRLGITDIDTALATGSMGGNPVKGLGQRLGRGAIGAFQEGVLEEMPQSMQEQIWQNVAEGRPWDEGIGKAAAMGAVSGGLMGGGINVMGRTSQPEQPKEPDAETKQATNLLGYDPNVGTSWNNTYNYNPIIAEGSTAQVPLNMLDAHHMAEQRTEAAEMMNADLSQRRQDALYDMPAFDFNDQTLPPVENPGDAVALLQILSHAQQNGQALPEGSRAHELLLDAQRILSENGLSYLASRAPEVTPKGKADGKPVSQVAQGSNQGSSGNGRGSTGNLGNQPSDGRGGSAVAGTPVGSGSTNQSVGTGTGGVGAVSLKSKPGTRAALKERVGQVFAPESQDAVDLINSIDTAKSYKDALAAVAKHSIEGLRVALSIAPPKEAAIVRAALGWDADNNQVVDKRPSLDKIGKQFGYKETNGRYGAGPGTVLNKFGITNKVLDRMWFSGDASTTNVGGSTAADSSKPQLLWSQEPSDNFNPAANDVAGQDTTQRLSDEYDRELGAEELGESGNLRVVKGLGANINVGAGTGFAAKLKELLTPSKGNAQKDPSAPQSYEDWSEAELAEATASGLLTDEQFIAATRALRKKLAQAQLREADQKHNTPKKQLVELANRVETAYTSPVNRNDKQANERDLAAYEEFKTRAAANEAQINERKATEAAEMAEAEKALEAAMLAEKTAPRTLLEDVQRRNHNAVENDIQDVRDEWVLSGMEEIAPFDKLDRDLQIQATLATINFADPNSNLTAQRFQNLIEDIRDEHVQRNAKDKEAGNPAQLHAGTGTGTATSERSEAAASTAASESPVVAESASSTENQPEAESADEGLTPQDIAQAWHEFANAHGLPKLAQLSSDQQEELFAAYDADSLQSAVDAIVQELVEDGKYSPGDGVKRSTNSEADSVTEPTTASAIKSQLKGLFFSGQRFDSKVVVVQSSAGLDPELRSKHDEKTQAFVKNGKVYLIADNIQQGKELAVFLHEVGAHLGMEKLLGAENYAKLVEQVKVWAENSDGKEGELARKAMERVRNAQESLGEEYGQQDFDDELLAYFVEESVLSGVNPTAISKAGGPMANWFRTFWAAVKVALRKFGFDRVDQLTAQNIVDIAYGAARLELEGTWHGTAADFRRFNHAYMGSGEGTGNRGNDTSDTGAFGWGTYLAQAPGIAHGYMEADAERKSTPPHIEDANGNRIKVGRSTGEVFAALAFSDTGSVAKAREKFVARKLPDAATQEGLAFLQRLEDVGARYIPRQSPEGSLMRVDTNAHDDEMLDWDKPLSEQSQHVKDALESVGLYGDADHMRRWQDSTTGEQLYMQLASNEDRLEDAGFTASQKGASEYLDSIGVKGIKFLDADSRNVNRELSIEEDNGKWFVYEHTDYSGGPATGVMHDSQDDAVIELLDLEQQYRERTPTRNLVIFNDKNIVRVATQRGARRDSGSIKYSTTGKVLPDFAEELFYPQSAEDRRNNYANRLKNPIHLKDGSRLSGFTDPSKQTTFHGYDKNGERFTLRVDQLNADDIAWSKDSNRTADKLRKALSGEEKVRRSVVASPQMRQVNTQVKTVLQQYGEFFGDKFQSVENALMFGHNLAKKAAALIPGAKAYFDSVQKRQTERVKQEQEIARIANAHYSLDTDTQKAVNRIIDKSTSEEKWAFVPTWFKDTKIAADPALAAEFAKLPKEAQQIVKDVFKYGSEQQQRFGESVNKNLPPEEQVKRNQMYGKPYAPLKRFGDHVVVGKSAEFAKLQAAHKEGTATSKELEAMMADPDHYHVEFVDGDLEAIKRRDQLAKNNPQLQWEKKPMQVEDRLLNAMSFTTLKRLEKQIAASDGNPKTKAALEALANQMYVAQLNHMHANKSQQSRKGVKGYDADMMRAFVSQGRAEAALIASLMTHAESEKALQAIKTAAREGGNQDRKTRIANEVMRRHLAMLNYQDTPIQNKLMAANSLFMLLTSPAYYLTNASQPFVVSLPYMASKFGGSQSWTTLRGAYKDALELVKVKKLFRSQDLSTDHLKQFNQVGREADALKTLMDENLVDIGMEMELGDIAAAGGNEISKRLSKAMMTLRTGVANVEVLNRLSSATAGYRLAYAEAISKGKDAETAHTEATDYARKVILDTHGNYAGYNAPSVMMQGAYGSVPLKLMTQFKKFAFIQAGLLIGSIKTAVQSQPSEERDAARALLKWMASTQFMLAGAMGGTTGIPAAILGSLAAAMGGDDGEDKEAYLRRILGGGALAQLILHGAPAALGVDISKRVGMGASLDPLRLTDPSTNAKDAALALAGPSVGLANRFATGLDYMYNKGQYWKGMEMMIPNGIATNLSKIARYEAQGLTNSRGDVVMKPEEIGLMTDLMQGLGLETTQLSDRRWKSQVIYDRKQHFEDKAAEIKRDYIEDRKAGGNGAEARQEWMKLQAERVKQGFQRQKMSDLISAPKAQAKRERDVVNGLQYEKTNKKFVQSVNDL